MTVLANERYLQAWHARHPDCGRIFSDTVDSEGQSSFERLASTASGAAVIVDLGCGSGRLLELCDRPNPHARKVGIDLSDAELRLAAARLPSAQLVQARAQELPFRADSADCVMCHMALMLMDAPEQVLAQASRILRPRGLFSAVTQRRTAPDETAGAIFAMLRALWNRSHSEPPAPSLGDTRTADANELHALAAQWFSDVNVHSFAVVQIVPQAELPDFLAEALYGVDALPRQDLAAALGDLHLPNPVSWVSPLLHLSARA